MFFSFLSFLVTLSSCTSVLWPFIYDIHCIYFHLYIYWCMLFFTYLFMCCFFSIFIHMFLYVCNLLFLFHTKMPWWVLFKVFQKDRLLKSIMLWTLFLQSFSRVCVRIRFVLYSNKWLWVYWFKTSLMIHLFVVVLSWITKGGRLLGYMWKVLETYVM